MQETLLCRSIYKHVIYYIHTLTIKNATDLYHTYIHACLYMTVLHHNGWVLFGKKHFLGIHSSSILFRVTFKLKKKKKMCLFWMILLFHTNEYYMNFFQSCHSTNANRMIW